MVTKESDIEAGQAKIGFKFDQDGRKWEVTIINFNSFNAKTIDGLKPHLTANFNYKK